MALIERCGGTYTFAFVEQVGNLRRGPEGAPNPPAGVIPYKYNLGDLPTYISVCKATEILSAGIPASLKERCFKVETQSSHLPNLHGRVKAGRPIDNRRQVGNLVGNLAHKIWLSLPESA
jgi:hypothetical protein